MGVDNTALTDFDIFPNNRPRANRNIVCQLGTWMNDGLWMNHSGFFLSAHKITPLAASSPLTNALHSNFQIPRRLEIIRASKVSLSPGITWRLKRNFSAPTNRYIEPSAGFLSMDLKPRMPAACAIASVINTPGITG